MEEVRIGDFVDSIELPVTIDGYEQAELMSRIEGYVGEVLVDIGDEVLEGQVLARLDLPEMGAEHRRKTKLVDQAEAQLNSQKFEVVRVQAHRAEQKALERLRESELERIGSLVQGGALKQEQLDESQYAYEAVQASLERIQADVRATEAEVVRAEATVDVAKAELDKTEVLMDYLEIKAPFDGVITARKIDPGAFVRPPSSGNGALPLFSIESIHFLRAVLMLPIEDAKKLDNGDSVMLQSIRGISSGLLENLCGLDGNPLSVSRNAGTFHRGSRMMRAEVDLDNPIDKETGRRLLRPGDYGKARVELIAYEMIPWVPFSAVGSDESGNYLMVVDAEGVCHRVDIEVLLTEKRLDRNNKLFEIAALSGPIRSGKRVVVQGLDEVEVGQRLP